MSGKIPPERSIFFSYAHEDKKILQGIRKPFLPLQRAFEVQFIWDDTRLKTGDKWKDEIMAYLNHAPVAILIVSQDFAGSDFISETELPTLLKRQRSGEVKLLPVIAGYVDLDALGLSDFQTIPPPPPDHPPLKDLTPARREKWYYELGLRVKEILTELLPTPPAMGETHTDNRDPDTPPPTLKPPDLGPLNAWNLTVPADMAVEEIEHQLRRLVGRTKNQGFLVFSRGAYYVQYAFYKEFDSTSVVIEVISNAYLPDCPLSKLQMEFLSHIGFTQYSDEENWIMLAPIDQEDALGKLSAITWRILDFILNCRWDSELEIRGQC